MKHAWIYLLLLSLIASAAASPRTQVKAGNQAAQEGLSDEAMVRYKTALEQGGDSSLILYDLGNVIYSEGQYEAAAKSFMGSFDPQDPPQTQSQSFYNLGNSLFQAQKYDQAIASYVEALKRNPEDTDARYNLELARRFLKQQQQQQQQQQQNQDQEQKEDEQKQDQPQQDEEKQDQNQQQEQQQEQNQEQQDEQQQQQSQPQPGQQMSQEDAERLLNALLQNEQNALKDVKKAKVARRAKREKDW